MWPRFKETWKRFNDSLRAHPLAYVLLFILGRLMDDRLVNWANNRINILPFTVLRRLDWVLEATKPAVLAELATSQEGRI
jgi:hypothetical protein